MRRTIVPNVADESYAIAAIRRSAARRRDLDIDRVRAMVRAGAPTTTTSHDRKVEERYTYIDDRDVRLFVGVFYSSLYNVAYIRMKKKQGERNAEEKEISLSGVLKISSRVKSTRKGASTSCFGFAVAAAVVAYLIIRLNSRRIIISIIVIVVVDVVRLFAGVLEPLEPFANLKQGLALARYGIVDVLSPLEKGIFFDDVQIVRVDEQTQ